MHNSTQQLNYKTSWYKPLPQKEDCCSSWMRWKMRSISSRRNISCCRRISISLSGALHILKVSSSICQCIVLDYIICTNFMVKVYFIAELDCINCILDWYTWRSADCRRECQEDSNTWPATAGKITTPKCTQKGQSPILVWQGQKRAFFKFRYLMLIAFGHVYHANHIHTRHIGVMARTHRLLPLFYIFQYRVVSTIFHTSVYIQAHDGSISTGWACH